LPERSVAALEQAPIWLGATLFHREPMPSRVERSAWGTHMRRSFSFFPGAISLTRSIEGLEAKKPERRRPVKAACRRNIGSSRSAKSAQKSVSKIRNSMPIEAQESVTSICVRGTAPSLDRQLFVRLIGGSRNI
jgi:hypothetical protein